jgi:hypothetical protein
VSLLRPAERIGLCPQRLVLAGQALALDGEPIEALRQYAGSSRKVVILSNHFARYAVLPWSAPLRSEEDWLAFARHAFAETYGAPAASWTIRVSRAARRKPRVACAVDTALLESLLGVPGVCSVQPYLMSAFNARRRRLAGRTAWFVVQEPGRLALGLIQDGEWRSVRVRQATAQWQDSLADTLEREASTLAQLDCEEVLVHGEEDLPPRAGRFRIQSLSLPAADLMVRRH